MWRRCELLCEWGRGGGKTRRRSKINKCCTTFRKDYYWLKRMVCMQAKKKPRNFNAVTPTHTQSEMKVTGKNRADLSIYQMLSWLIWKKPYELKLEFWGFFFSTWMLVIIGVCLLKLYTIYIQQFSFQWKCERLMMNEVALYHHSVQDICRRQVQC